MSRGFCLPGRSQESGAADHLRRNGRAREHVHDVAHPAMTEPWVRGMVCKAPRKLGRTTVAVDDPATLGSKYLRMSNLSTIELTAERCEVECIHPEHVAPLIGRVISHDIADEVASTFALLADPTRARILHALSLSDELCVCDLAALLGITESALSHQLRLLRLNRVVTRRKAGRIMYYRIADHHVSHILSDGVRHATEDVVGEAE